MWKKVVITGGLGFLGSNLAHAFAPLCEELHVVDNSEPGLGANPQNLRGIAGEYILHDLDVREMLAHPEIMQGADLLLHCAGNGDHGASMRDPIRDLGLNAQASLTVLESVRQHAPGCRVLTMGTRAEYGPVQSLPVREDSHTDPLGCYAVSKLAATGYALVYANYYKLDIVALRVTNIYGERAQMRHPGYGVANWFLRQAMAGETIRLFGDGAVRRDYTYIQDFTEAVVRVSACAAARGQLLNLGGAAMISLSTLAESVVAAAGKGSIQFVPYPEGKEKLEPGDFQADIEALKTLVSWTPQVSLAEGMRRSVAYYQAAREPYWV